MNQIEKLFQKNADPACFAVGYLDHLVTLIQRLDIPQITAFLQTLMDARERQSNIFFIGNGGSAATASHFANDISIGSRSRAKPFRALSLCDNLAVITAIGNDFGYDQIFLRQLENQMVAGDVVVAISASGNSENLLIAMEYANAQGAITVALTGFDGGRLQSVVKHNVHVATSKGEYGPVEDIHMILDHLVGAYLMLHVRMESVAEGSA